MRRKLLSFSALGAVLALAACGNDNGPGGDSLSTQEQAALIQALSTHQVFAPGASLALSPLFNEATVGTMGDFAAVGSQVKITIVDGSTSTTSVITSLTGWAGLDAGAKTVDSALTVASFLQNAATFPSTVQADLSAEGYATYYDGTSTYLANSGDFAVTSTAFGSTQDCPNIEPGSGINACRFAVGTMTGSFDFEAENASNDTYTRGNTSFSVPAVQLSITIDASAQ